jgi:hypothetical protein
MCINSTTLQDIGLQCPMRHFKAYKLSAESAHLSVAGSDAKSNATETRFRFKFTVVSPSLLTLDSTSFTLSNPPPGQEIQDILTPIHL